MEKEKSTFEDLTRQLNLSPMVIGHWAAIRKKRFYSLS